MAQVRISEAASFMGVSDDTVRRWIDQGQLTKAQGAGPATVDTLELAALAREHAILPVDRAEVARSARNQFVGIVTSVVTDTVMAQVEMQCGPHRVVSLISSEAVRELALEPGSVATAVVKATNVMIESES